MLQRQRLTSRTATGVCV
jgi:hypothetical protein